MMKIALVILFFNIIFVKTFDREAIVQYAKQHWNSPNHRCGSHTDCSPYSYWGSEHCGYGSHGGDCANFVSQCLLQGGHKKLLGGECRGYPCGIEEVGAKKLGVCLTNTFHWTRRCGYLMKPPQEVRPGDVLIYHKASCDDASAHATIVLTAGNGDATIACHSSAHYGTSYTYMSSSYPYYEWLMHI